MTDSQGSDGPRSPNQGDAEHVREPEIGIAKALGMATDYFMGKADVQAAARRLAARFDELEIAYAIAGGLAVTAHGHVRVTRDVDVLLTPDDLRRFKDESLGRGWIEKFANSKGVKDAQLGVPIDILLTGDFPGDGREKPIAFPDPRDVSLLEDGVSYLTLPALIELKLASGMTAPDRPRDLDDVIQLIRANALGADFRNGLHEFVTAKYDELWGYAQHPSGDE